MIIISARDCLSAEGVPGISHALSHLLTHEVSKKKKKKNLSLFSRGDRESINRWLSNPGS